MSIEITILITICGSIVGSLGTLAAISHRNKSELKADASEKSVAIHEIRVIAEDVKDIKRDIREYRQELQAVRDKVIVAEQSIKSLHKRVDKIEGGKTV